MEGREGLTIISHKGDKQHFEERKAGFSSECLIVFATGCNF